VLDSISRLMHDIASKSHRDGAGMMRELMAAYRDHEDLISIGAYRKGANRMVDTAIDMLDELNKFLRQRVDESSSVKAASEALEQIHRRALQRQTTPSPAPTPST
jgi:flagellum-specific ATP synthase